MPLALHLSIAPSHVLICHSLHTPGWETSDSVTDLRGSRKEGRYVGGAGRRGCQNANYVYLRQANPTRTLSNIYEIVSLKKGPPIHTPRNWTFSAYLGNAQNPEQPSNPASGVASVINPRTHVVSASHCLSIAVFRSRRDIQF